MLLRPRRTRSVRCKANRRRHNRPTVPRPVARPAVTIAEAHRRACVDRPPWRYRFAQERSGFAQERNSDVRCVAMPSTSDVPRLRCVRRQLNFGTGTNVVPALLGRKPDELENSEDCGSAGGHGNQHVRLRSASIDALIRSARLRQQRVAAGRASFKFSTSSTQPAAITICFHPICFPWRVPIARSHGSPRLLAPC